MKSVTRLHRSVRHLLPLGLLAIASCGDSGAPRGNSAAAPENTVGTTINAAALCTSTPDTNSTLHALRHDGLNLVDDYQRVVLLHGLNAVWKLTPYTPPDQPGGFTAADADFLQAHGFNAIRLGVLFEGVMPQPGTIDSGYLDQVDRMVQLLTQRGIYVLLDFHQDAYSQRFNGEGFPDWAVYDDGLPFVSTNSFFANYFTPAVARTFDNLYANEGGIWGYYASAWAAVAQRWHGQPYLLGYDIINEPAAGSQQATCASPVGCPQFDPTLQAFEDLARVAIRANDTTHLVWYEPQLLFQFPVGKGNFTAVDDAQAAFSWHNYACSGAFLNAEGLPSGPDCPTGESLVFSKAATQAATMKAGSLLTEFGATDDDTDIARMTAYADSNLVGWLYWAYKTWNDPTTTGGGGAESLFTDDGNLATVKTAKLDVLERTYPQATAGVPQTLSFDPATAIFDYSYTPSANCSITEIYVPVALHYPNGYATTLTGARQVSADNASQLVVENLPGATTVEVKLRPL